MRSAGATGAIAWSSIQNPTPVARRVVEPRLAKRAEEGADVGGQGFGLFEGREVAAGPA
jgi:hypothetical protein